MITRIAASVLALASFNASAHNATTALPHFELPYACAYSFTGTTTATAQPNRAIEFQRSSAVADPVLASAAGVVRVVRNARGRDAIHRYVVVDHGGGWSTTYSNLSRIDVRKHARVEAGQRLGMIGRLDGAQTTYLHYMQSHNGSPVSATFNGQPVRYFGQNAYISLNNCGTSGAVDGQVDLGDGAHGFVWVREAMSARARPFGELFNTDAVKVECQAVGGNYLLDELDRPSPEGSELWYRVTFNGQKGFVPAAQVRLDRGAKAELCMARGEI